MTAKPYGRGRPYPAKSMARARELHAAGWYPSKVREHMLTEGIPTPDLMTVKRWCDEDYNQAQLRTAREIHSRKRARTATFRLAGARKTPTAAYRAEFVAALEREGVNRDEIPKVCRVVLGEAGVRVPKRGQPAKRVDWDRDTHDRLLAAGMEMRRRGLPYPSISAVFAMYEGAEITADALRRWLTLHGAERNQNKVRGVTA